MSATQMQIVTALQQFRQSRAYRLYKRLQVLDEQAGELLGNARHVRALGVGDFDYALTLGLKVFMAGLTIALVELMMSLIFMLNVWEWSFIASVGSGFVIYIVANWLYPGKISFVLGFCMGIGIMGFAGAAAGIHGVSAGDSLEPIFRALFPLALGGLIAGYLAEVVFTAIARAFATPEVYPFSLSRLMRLKLLTDEEYRQRKVFSKSYARRLSVGLVSLITAFATLFVLAGNRSTGSALYALDFAALLGSTVYIFYQLWRIEQAENALRDRVLARLQDEERFSVATVEVSYAVGWVLDGKFYPDKRSTLSAAD